MPDRPVSPHAIIFDLKDVLIDSSALVERSWRRWAGEHDSPLEDIESIYHGRPAVEIIRAVAPHLDAASAAQRKRDRDAADTEGVATFDGAPALPQSLPEDR